jgi:amino acid permease
VIFAVTLALLAGSETRYRFVTNVFAKLRSSTRSGCRNVPQMVVLCGVVVMEGARRQNRRIASLGYRAAAWLAWPLYGLMTCLVIITSGVTQLRQAGSTKLFQLPAMR